MKSPHHKLINSAIYFRTFILNYRLSMVLQFRHISNFWSGSLVMFLFICSCVAKNKIILSDGTYKEVDQLTEMRSKEIHYYSSGEKKYDFWIVNGKRDSTALFYSKDGVVKISTIYKDGNQSKIHHIYINNVLIEDTLKTIIHANKEVRNGEKFRASIYFSDSTIKIYQAYYFCDSILNQDFIDTSTLKKLNGNPCYQLTVSKKNAGKVAKVSFNLHSRESGIRVHNGFLIRKLYDSDFLALYPFKVSIVLIN